MRATKAELFQVEGQHTGLLVAIWLDAPLAAQLAIPGGEPADQLHITLCYCGDANAMTDVQIGRAIAAVAESAAMWGPLTGQIAGVGRFNASDSSDGKDVFYANVDVPGLAEMRQMLASTLEYMADCPPLSNHGYTPHITLAYIDAGADLPMQRIESQPITIRSIWVGVGDRRTEIQLTGDYKSIAGAKGKEMGKLTKSFETTLKDGWIIASTPAVDRDRDRIMPMGGDLSNFQKNPVLIFGHNYHEPWAVIGRVAETSVDMAGIRMRPELREPANESDPQHIIRALWEQGLLRTASIGFIPIESRENEFGGRDYLKWELLELSLTPLPANQEAIRLTFKALTTTSQPYTKDNTDDPAPATTDDGTELTAEQLAELATTLTALTDELTQLFTGD